MPTYRPRFLSLDRLPDPIKFTIKFTLILLYITGFLCLEAGAAEALDIRVNCGGGQYADGAGNVWSADTGFNTGRTGSTADAIANTTDDPLYRTERWDPLAAPDLAYSFSVPNGDYQVNLHFAEIYGGASFMGGRVFDVEIEGVLVLDNLDIFAEVGADAALIETIPVTVSDSQLNIVFRHGVEDPKVSAIEILDQGIVEDSEPPSVPGGLTGTAAGPSSINLNWNDSSDTGGSGLGGYLVFRIGAQVGDVTGSSFSDTGLSAGTTYTYTVLAYDNAGNQSAQSGSIDVATPSGTAADIRVNCGGGQYTDGAGNVWSADTGFNTGRTGSTADAIAGTTDDPLYRTERWDPLAAPDLAYSFSVPDGDYQVNLHFAEIYGGAGFVGGRVFDVEIEGVLVLDNLDIFAEVGADAALIETIPVTVSDGQLNIVFRHGVEDPKVSAIEILGQGTIEDTEPPSVPGGLTGAAAGPSGINLDWNDSSDTGGSGLGGYLVFRNGAQVGDVTGSSFSDTGLGAGTTYTYTVLAYDNAGNQSAQSESIDVTTPSGTVTDIRVNCGGSQYTDGAGNVWSADTGFNAGRTGSTADAIANTTDDPLYRTERWDPLAAPDLAYSFSVPNGDYQVNLHFAEIYGGASFVGGRVFDVEIEGVLVLENLDIFAEAGADAALIETIPVTVSDGQLNIVFRHGVEDPKVSAIEIISYARPALPITENFTSPNPTDWIVVNDSGIASSWSMVDSALHQQNVVEAKPGAFEQSYHKGSFIFYRHGFGLNSYRFEAEMTPLADDVIPSGNLEGNDVGVMFNYLNPLNYYRLTMSVRYGFTRFEKVVNGKFTTLAVDATGYLDNATYAFKADINGPIIQIFLNGDPLFSVSDSSIRGGTIALYSQDDAEFDNLLIGTAISQPSITLTRPLAYQIATTDIGTLSAEAAATNVPAGGYVAFTLDGGNTMIDATAPYEATFLNVAPGNHTVGAVLRDSFDADLAWDTNEVVGVLGDYVVAVGDSIHHGFGDNGGVRTSLDDRMVSARGFESRLNDLLTSTLGYPNIVFNEGIGGDKSADALQRIDSIIERHPTARTFLILLGTNDSGAGISAATFKNNMQSLINKLTTSGKEVWIAMAPPVFNPDGTPNLTRNSYIEAYNRKIDESDGDPLTGHHIGPDLYNFFITRFALYDDTLHPNENGHEAMAYLWYNALNPGDPLTIPDTLLNP